MSSRSSPLVITAALALAACSPRPVLDNPDVEGLRALGDQVQSERLIGLVTDLTQVHRTDTPFDCKIWPYALPARFCNLSRTKIQDLMVARFTELGLQVRRQELTSEQYSTANVIADIPGTTHPEEVVLVGAHFDAFWDGADDNSSGIAAMLELARVLSQRRFDRTIRFVGFDLEEFGSIGSSRYVDAQSPNEKLVLALVFDCLGYYSTEPGSQRSIPGLPSPDRGDFLLAISNDATASLASELYALSREMETARVIPLVAPADGAVPLAEPLLRSDHTSFWLKGHPALFVSDTALYRNPNYHTTRDTVETLHPELYGKTVKLMASAIGYWAGGPR